MIGIHQPQFLPWLPYIYKVMFSDMFVLLDSVQYEKNGVQNRNMIKTPQGVQWLTIPVHSPLGTSIDATTISDPRSLQKALRTLEMNYRNSRCFGDVFPCLEQALSAPAESLADLNENLLRVILGLLKIGTPIVRSSTLPTAKTKDELVIEIIEHFGGNDYLSGSGALGYMQKERFQLAGISVHLAEFDYQPYPQLWSKQVGFAPELSVVDLLFNHLDGASGYIQRNGRHHVLTEW